MKNYILKGSLVVALGFSFIGCSGSGGSLTTPVTKRGQDISVDSMKKVRVEAPKAFKETLSNPKYKNVQTYTLGELKTKNKDLYDLIYPIAKDAKKLYMERKLPKDVLENGPQWLVGDDKNLEKLRVTLANTTKKDGTPGSFNGRYSPYNDLLILNYNNKIDKKLAQFLIAHEFGHAIALHASEDRTAQDAMLKGASDAGEVALDVSINEAYKSLKDKDKARVDEVAELLFSQLPIFSKKDIEEDNKLMENRKNGFAAKAAIKAGKKDQLNKLGIDLEVPQKTRIVLKKLLKSGLDASGAIDMLKQGVDVASANVIAVTQHSKKQEMEADSIALQITNDLGYNSKDVVCKRFEGKKEAGLLDAHPSYSDRRENLKCAK